MTAPLSPAEKKAQADEYARNTARLEKIIRPLRTAEYECDHAFSYLEQTLGYFEKDWGGLELCPDFQRGHVWTPEQQQHFIENVLRGVVSSAGLVVQFNCPNWNNSQYAGDLPRGLQCIDGLQRITAVRGFMDGSVRPFGLSRTDLENSSYSVRGSNYRLRFAIHNFQSKAELLQHYLDLNAGGTQHTQEELSRVRAMLQAAQTVSE